MKHSFLLTLLATTLIASGVFAGEETVGLEKQKNLNIVIYNNNMALVKDMRNVALKAGKNEVAYAGISGQIIPSSVILDGKNVTFLENNFNFDVLSYQSLLQKSVGETVTLQYMNPKSGVLETDTAELVSYNNGNPVLRINGKIDASYPGRIVFNRLPTQLRVKPTLVMNIAANQPGNQDLTLNYLTNGLSWDASYVAQINADNTQMALNGWVTLTNNSGMDYQNAHMQVVAGDVHTVSEPVLMRRSMNKSMAYGDTLAAAAPMTEESIADYHLYTLPRTTDILNNQTKQVSLLSADKIGIRKKYTFNNQLRPHTEAKNIKPNVSVQFKNTKENQLGIALPRGVVRLYQADKKGDLIFVGEDRISHVGNLEEVNLNMGTAFDISATARRIQNNEKDEPITQNRVKHISVNTYEIILKNGTKSPVKVEIQEDFTPKARILSETKASKKLSANRYEWSVQIPAEGEEKLTYTVREEF